MTNFKPLIRKNLIYVKRNIFKTLIQLFYPCIFLGVFLAIWVSNNGDEPQPAMTHYDYAANLDLQNANYSEMGYYGDDIATIGNNSTVDQKLTYYLKNITGN
jgi:hypothetical protein